MDFPDDLIAEILFRLPVKSLLRFKSVSRSWRSLISSRYFITKHLTRTSDFAHERILLNFQGSLEQCSLSSLMHDPTVEPLDVDCSPNPYKNSLVWVLGSCHGLVCLTVDRKHLILWNPSLKTFRQLPDFGVDVDFDCRCAHGLGFDKSTDDYKLVRFCKDGGNHVVVKSYSLKSNEWRTMRDHPGRPWPRADPAVFVNGKLYWNTFVDRHFESRWDIVSVDLETEEHGAFQMPNYVQRGLHSILGVSGEKLCIVCCHSTSSDVWLGNEEGSWTKMVTIPDFYYVYLQYECNRLLYVTEKGEILLQSGSNIMIFDSRDSSIRYPVLRKDCFVCPARTYMETLVSPFYL